MNNAFRNSVITAMMGIAVLAVAPQARSQTAQVGDLVEIVSGLGPTLAEIVVGPDAGGYVVIQIPTGKQIPVNTQKLRLVQKAGTPNAPMRVGTAVSWTDAQIVERGSVVKVNGNWCQVKTPDATTIGWVECKDLRTGTPGAAPATAAKPAPAAGSAAAQSAIKLPGNWENADGTVKLEFQAASKCYISIGPMTGACTYKQSAQGVNVSFQGVDLALAANDDGSLSNVDANALMPIRLKKK
ncbi:MAG: hypothetical protein HOP16_03430 [Acidobacteria bacterium]|nr:hypothetical protein [Acidobacteriota bacterium]